MIIDPTKDPRDKSIKGEWIEIDQYTDVMKIPSGWLLRSMINMNNRAFIEQTIIPDEKHYMQWNKYEKEQKSYSSFENTPDIL